MKRALAFSAALLLAAAGVFAQDPAKIEADAKRAFDSGRFKEAGDRYAKAADVEGLTAGPQG